MEEEKTKKSFIDYLSLALSTVGVGYIPLAPGTWGSAVGVLIYLGVRQIETVSALKMSAGVGQNTQISAWIFAVNSILLLIFCLAGILASDRASVIFNKKDPQKVVIDEVMGQLITFAFVPFEISWKFVLAGFLLFRLFDIWKPYPIDLLQGLPSGIGVCADDILAGVYGGIVLSLLYAIIINIQ